MRFKYLGNPKYVNKSYRAVIPYRYDGFRSKLKPKLLAHKTLGKISPSEFVHAYDVSYAMFKDVLTYYINGGERYSDSAHEPHTRTYKSVRKRQVLYDAINRHHEKIKK